MEIDSCGAGCLAWVVMEKLTLTLLERSALPAEGAGIHPHAGEPLFVKLQWLP